MGTDECCFAKRLSLLCSTLLSSVLRSSLNLPTCVFSEWSLAQRHHVLGGLGWVKLGCEVQAKGSSMVFPFFVCFMKRVACFAPSSPLLSSPLLSSPLLSSPLLTSLLLLSSFADHGKSADMSGAVFGLSGDRVVKAVLRGQESGSQSVSPCVRPQLTSIAMSNHQRSLEVS